MATAPVEALDCVDETLSAVQDHLKTLLSQPLEEAMQEWAPMDKAKMQVSLGM